MDSYNVLSFLFILMSLTFLHRYLDFTHDSPGANRLRTIGVISVPLGFLLFIASSLVNNPFLMSFGGALLSVVGLFMIIFF